LRLGRLICTTPARTATVAQRALRLGAAGKSGGESPLCNLMEVKHE